MNNFWKFAVLMMGLGLVLMILKPFYDVANNTTIDPTTGQPFGIIPATSNVTTFETSWFQFLPWLIPLLIIGIGIFKFLKRED